MPESDLKDNVAIITGQTILMGTKAQMASPG